MATNANSPEGQAALRKNSQALVKLFRRGAGQNKEAGKKLLAKTSADQPAPTADKSGATTRTAAPPTGSQAAEGGANLGPAKPKSGQTATASGGETLDGQTVVSRNLAGQAIGEDGKIIRGGEQSGDFGFGKGTGGSGTAQTNSDGSPLSPAQQAAADAGLPIPPQLPEFREEFQEGVDRVTDERLGAEQSRVDAQTETAQGARDISSGIQAEVGAVRGQIGRERSELAGEQATFRQDLETRQQELSTLATDVKGEFDSIRTDFNSAVSGALTDVRGAQSQALNGVYTGQAQAMQAAVQGIQGNVNTQIAQINGNPNLTAAQKQQMINQVKMTGAMALAPAIGATQLQFNTLATNVNTQFGQMLTQVEQAGLAGRTQLGTAGGQAFAAASNAMNQMSNQILELGQSSDLAFSSQQQSLIGLRNQASNIGNQLMTQILPETTMPYHDYGDIYAENLQNNVDLVKLDIKTSLEQFGLDATLAQMALAIGTPNERLFEAALAGFQSGGVGGALLAGIGSALS